MNEATDRETGRGTVGGVGAWQGDERQKMQFLSSVSVF